MTMSEKDKSDEELEHNRRDLLSATRTDPCVKGYNINGNTTTTTSFDDSGRRKQSVHVTRSDPLSSTSHKSHSIRNKHPSRHSVSSQKRYNHNCHYQHPSSTSSQPATIFYPCRERRARWIRDRMGDCQNSNSVENPRFYCCDPDTSHSHSHDNNATSVVGGLPLCHHCGSENTSCVEDFEWTKFNNNGSNCNSNSAAAGGGDRGQHRRHYKQQPRYDTRQNSRTNWISENDSKASRFHRPYSLREQRSWMLDNQSTGGDPQYQSRNCCPSNPQQARLRAGLSLPVQQTNFQLISEDIEASAGKEEHKEGEEDDEDEEGGDEVGHSYLTRQNCRKGNYQHHRRQPSATGSLGVEDALGNFQRRSRSGSPCSITSESTDSLGDCENALDPPRLPNGDIGGGGGAEGGAGAVMPVQYMGNGGGNGRKFSVLFSSQDTWNEDNIIQSLKELTPDATAIFEAAWAGDVRQLEQILKEGNNLERLKDAGTTGLRDGEGRTPLHLASACGHVDCVKLFIEKGAPVNATDGKEARATPLTCAASCGSVPVVNALLAGGANVNAGYEHGKTALHWAIQAGSVECAKVLLEAEAKQNPPQVYSETALHVAASQGDPECLQLLLDYGADVNLCKGTNRSTALHLSCEEGSVACVRLLLKAGATHAAKDIRGHTALHVAATCDADCVIVLLKSGADPNAVDANGRTPLHCAVARGSRAAECVRLLVEKGADIDAQDNYGYTPLHLSAVNESSQCAAILLHHGSDVTLKTNAGTNALTLLVRRIPDVMRYLVDRLDSAVTIHDHDPADPDCEVRLDFRAIVPNCEKRHGNANGNGNKKNNGNGHAGGGEGNGNGKKQQSDYFSRAHKETEFLTCLMAVGNKKILAHPLSEAFLTLKWRRVRKFFWASLLFQIALVALFTIYVVEVYLIRCPYRRGPHNNDSSDGLEESRHTEDNHRADTLTTLPPIPVPPDLTTRHHINKFGMGHDITRRSAEADARDWSDKWFGFMPPPKKTTTTRPRKKPKTSQPNQTLPSYSSPAPASPPFSTRNRSRSVNISIGRPVVEILNVSVYGVPAPASPADHDKPSVVSTASTNEEPPSEDDTDRTPRFDSIDCQFDPILQTIWILLVTFAGLMATKEIFQLLQSPLSYVGSSENWGQWLLISSVSLTAWSTPEFRLEYWQYPAAACGIFLAWGLMLLQVGRFPALGVYVQMLGKVAANFGLFILAYACLLIAFALAFCVLFPEHPPYSTVLVSILKVFTMMVGEVDYEDLFYNEDRRNDPILFPITAHLLYGAFVVFVTIVLMNLLVGLAVHDIQGLQKGAKLNRLCRQTALISRLESFIFSKKLQSLLPNSLGSILQKSALLVPSSYNWSYYFRPNDPRDKRLPKEIKLASVRLAASRHSCTKSKSPHPPHHPPQHRNTHVTSTSTPLPPAVRPLSSVSHHVASNLMPFHHQDVALRRLDQRLDHLQNQLGKALNTLNRRMDQVLGAMGNPPSASHHRLSSSFKTINNLSVSQKSHSDNENGDDNVFTEDNCRDGMIVTGSSSMSPCSSFLDRRVKPPMFSQSPVILKDVSCEKG